MSIQNVNGRNVYVLSPREPSGKTTSGKNWATLYSDLRWQVWEAQQANEANKMKLDMMSFEAQRDYYKEQKKFLQNRIADLEDIKLKSGGGASDAINQALRAQEAIAPKSLGGRGASGAPKYSRKEVTGRTNVFGEVIAEPLVTKTYSGVPSELPPEIQAGAGGAGPTIIQPSAEDLQFKEQLAQRARKALEEEAKGGGEVTIDAEIAKLEQQLSELQAPQFETDTDLLSRTQRAFAQNVGVIGQGGGPFGLAPRSARLAPRVDQPTATAAAQELMDAVSQEKAYRQAASNKLKDLYIERAQSPIRTSDTSPEVNLLTAKRDEDIKALEEVLSQPTIVEQGLSDPRFQERAAGEFLLRRRAEAAALGVPAESILSEVPPAAPPAPLPPTRREKRAAEKADEALEVSRNPEPVEPALSSFRLPALDAAGLPLNTAPRKIPTVTVGRPTEDKFIEEVSQNFAQSDEEKTAAQAQKRNAALKEFSIQYGPIKVNADTGASEMLPVDPALNEKIYKSFIQEGPVFKDDAEGRAWYQSKIEQFKSQTPAQGKVVPTQKQRKDMYALTITADGLKLAQQPKKLERLARTKEDEDKRPRHIAVVDKIYDINKGKSNAFKMSYDEITRVFANDPQKRKEAHTYLVAKDSLETSKNEPMV